MHMLTACLDLLWPWPMYKYIFFLCVFCPYREPLHLSEHGLSLATPSPDLKACPDGVLRFSQAPSFWGHHFSTLYTLRPPQFLRWPPSWRLSSVREGVATTEIDASTTTWLGTASTSSSLPECPARELEPQRRPSSAGAREQGACSRLPLTFLSRGLPPGPTVTRKT